MPWASRQAHHTVPHKLTLLGAIHHRRPVTVAPASRTPPCHQYTPWVAAHQVQPRTTGIRSRNRKAFHIGPGTPTPPTTHLSAATRTRKSILQFVITLIRKVLRTRDGLHLKPLRHILRRTMPPMNPRPTTILLIILHLHILRWHQAHVLPNMFQPFLRLRDIHTHVPLLAPFQQMHAGY